MTVGEMRKLMVRKVVPENVVPQNIIDFLIDETAELPEPDAFTFLNRLRTLGMGSADFLYLMEGCGAPKAAVDKIRANPAMSLQSLILTLENSGMTSKDYTRMLYTARQIWERTLTLRLLNSEKIVEDGYPDESAPEEEYEEYDEPSFEEVMEDEVKGEPMPELPDYPDFSDDEEEETPAENDNIPDEEPEEDAYEDLPDEDASGQYSYTDDSTGVVYSREGTFEFEYVPDDNGSDEDVSVEEDTEPDGYENEFPDENDENVEEDEYAEEVEEFEQVEKAVDKRHFEVNIDYGDEEPPAGSGYNGDTTRIVQIDSDALKENLARLAGEEETPETEEDTEEEPEKTNIPHAVGRQVENDDEYGEDDEYDEDDEDDEDARSHRKAALIASSVGAAVLLGAAAAFYFGLSGNAKIQYAADENTIFERVSEAYLQGVSGGASAENYGHDNDVIFGNLLVHSGGFGTFSDGSSVCEITSEEITAHNFSDGELTPIGKFTPPDGTKIVGAVKDGGALFAVFDGDICGFMKIQGGSLVYTVRQDGSLTDFAVEDGLVKLGSVYTPKFYETVHAEDTKLYLPKTGTDEMQPIPAQNVILTGTAGYSYGVSAAFSAENGQTLSACAALGDPVFADCDGIFALNGAEEGLIVRAGEKVEHKECGKISTAAFGESAAAIYENGEITVLDGSFTPCSKIVELTNIPEYMRFSGNNLIVSSGKEVFLIMNCADPQNPATLNVTQVDGITDGESALVLAAASDGMTVSRYVLENGAAVQKYSYSKRLSEEEMSSLEFGNSQALVLDGELCGAAFSYFDGVCVVSEYVTLGSPNTEAVLYDDREGFKLAFAQNGKIYALCGEGVVDAASLTS